MPAVEPLSAHRATRKNRVESALEEYRCNGRTPAPMRALPPPFQGWCTVSSDADSPNMEGFLSTGRLLRERFALPVSDSTFPHWFFNQGLRNDETAEPVFADFGKGETFDFATFLDNCGPWLRQAYRGRVDTVHGWLLRQMIRIGNDIVVRDAVESDEGEALFDKALKAGRKVSKVVKRAATGHHPPARRRIVFDLPEGWHPRVPPRYFVFRFRAPTTGHEARLAFMDGEATVAEVDLTELRNGSPETLQSYVVDLHRHVTRDKDVLKRLDVELVLVSTANLLEIRDPMMVTWLSDDIAEQMTLFEALNLRFNTYTSHGGGYNIGHYKTNTLAAADVRGMADWPDNPYFALDLFEDYGLRFFNTASNTSRHEPVALSELLLPKTVNDGTTLYDFHRFNHVPKDAEGQPDFTAFEMFGTPQNPSMANLAGWQVEKLIDFVNEADGGDIGGLVYTHLLAKCMDDPDRLDRTFDGLFNAETQAAMERLARSFYGLAPATGTGTTGDRRIWVAPQAAILRLSQISAGLRHWASYDEAANEVHVTSWADNVTGEVLPRDAGGATALRHATFYVRDASTARMFIDDEEILSLVRNPADETGRESITVADASTPSPVLGRVPFGERGDRVVSCENATVTAIDGPLGHRLEVSGDEAAMTIRTSQLDLADQSHIRAILTGDLSDVGWSVSIRGASGRQLAFSVGGSPLEGAVHAMPGPDAERSQEVVVPLYRMTEAAGTAEPPGWPVEEIVVAVTGAAGRSIDIRLDLLRDDPRVFSDEAILGGHVAAGLNLDKVVMTYDGRRLEARVTPGGWYAFLDPVPRGAIVSLHGETCDGKITATADYGRRYEVTSDTFEIDFTAADGTA